MGCVVSPCVGANRHPFPWGVAGGSVAAVFDASCPVRETYDAAMWPLEASCPPPGHVDDLSRLGLTCPRSNACCRSVFVPSHSPPTAVQTVLTAVAIMLGQQEPSWTEVRRVSKTSRPSFIVKTLGGIVCPGDISISRCRLYGISCSVPLRVLRPVLGGWGCGAVPCNCGAGVGLMSVEDDAM